MTDRLVAYVVAFAVALIDRWLDTRIERSRWDRTTKERARLLEDELVRMLEPFLKELARVFAKPLVGRALARAFPNDPTTGAWAG